MSRRRSEGSVDTSPADAFNQCANCGVPSRGLRKCCGLVRYCTPQCQRNHWPKHQSTCTYDLHRASSRAARQRNYGGSPPRPFRRPLDVEGQPAKRRRERSPPSPRQPYTAALSPAVDSMLQELLSSVGGAQDSAAAVEFLTGLAQNVVERTLQKALKAPPGAARSAVGLLRELACPALTECRDELSVSLKDGGAQPASRWESQSSQAVADVRKRFSSDSPPGAPASSRLRGDDSKPEPFVPAGPASEPGDARRLEAAAAEGTRRNRLITTSAADRVRKRSPRPAGRWPRQERRSSGGSSFKSRSSDGDALTMTM